MSSVIKEKRKPLLKRVIDKIKPEPLLCEERGIDPNVSLNDIHTRREDIATIASRRNELKGSKQDKSDAMVAFRNNG